MLYMSPTFGYPPEYPYYQYDNIMYYVFESEKTANVVTYYMEFRVGWRPFVYRDAVTIPELIIGKFLELQVFHRVIRIIIPV